MKKAKNAMLVFLVFMVINSIQAQELDSGNTQVGEEVLITFNSPHPYESNMTQEARIVWQEEVFIPGASYIAPHFSKVELDQNDFLIVRSPDNSRSWKYSFSEIFRKNNNDGFWGIPIYGERVIIEIYSQNSKGSYGYSIDKVAKGYSVEKLNSMYGFSSLCGEDDSENAICYFTSQTFDVYEESRAVARLWKNGIIICTSWLIGDEGHLMTNEHCIQNQNDADNISVEFMAEGSTCEAVCNFLGACPGQIVANSGDLVRVNSNLDYALLRLPNNVTDTYGFLQLREAGGILNERIYIPQHPAGWGKRIALYSDSPTDNGLARIYSLSEPRCGGTGSDVGYFADTQDGSSGSPVIAYGDNLVVALHHCGGCPNLGVPIQYIIDDLGDDLPNNSLPDVCPQNLAIDQNVIFGQIDIQEAENTISATNTIFNGGTAAYDAGTSVRLKPGFHARSGSDFWAYIEGCTSKISPISNHKQEFTYYREQNSIQNDANKHPSRSKHLEIYPNPTDDVLIVTGVDEAVAYLLTDMAGKKITGQILNKEEAFKINTSDLAIGVYILKVTLADGKIITEKVLKK